MFRKISSLILIYCFAVLMMACPSRSTVKQAFETSREISVYGKQATIAVGDLYVSGIITFEQKEKYVVALRKIQTSGVIFYDRINELRKIYQTKLPDEEISALDIFFNQQIIAPLAEILIDAANLSKEKARAVYLAIAVLKQAVLIISAAFGKTNAAAVSFNFYEENYTNA